MAILLLFAIVQIDPNQKYLDYLSSSLVDHNGVRMDIKCHNLMEIHHGVRLEL